MTHFMMYYTNISVNLLFLSKYKSIKRFIFNGKAHSAYLPTIKYHILPSTNNNYFSLANKFDKWKETLKN